MSKKLIRLELDSKIICQKKLDPNDSLSSIRQAINDRIGDALFKDKDGNLIETKDENEFTLEDILYDNILKLKSQNSTHSAKAIFLNGSNFCSIELGEKEILPKLRDLLCSKVQNDFNFLDNDGNVIEKKDEAEFTIEDILADNIIKIKSSVNVEKINNISSNITQTVIPPQNIPQQKQNLLEYTFPKMNYDLSKYKKIKEEDGIPFYLYSEKNAQSNHELVKQYYFDSYDDDISKYIEAKIILFVGKTGDGKSTAINAFFNVIKGVRLEDDFRFILIKEPQKKSGQAESQTDGVHIYYLKDANNKPLVILDSQGFGDTRGMPFDQKVITAFSHIFSQVIDHINAVCFIVKSTDARLNINIKYIFNQVTGLFSEDISINFFSLATHAVRQDLENEPSMIRTLETDEKFKEIKQKMPKKWYYALDSTTILSKDYGKLAIFSYRQLLDLYNEKVINSYPISVRKCSEVLNIRNDLIIQINNLHTTFGNLLSEQGNLKEKEKSIQNVDLQIKQAEEKIKEEKEKFKTLKGSDLEKALTDLNEEINRKLYEIGNKEEKKEIKKLVEGSGSNYTHCQDCESNCHDPCDCFHLWTTRCTIYPLFGNGCEKCGHDKYRHTRDKFRYTYVYINVKTIDSSEIEKVKEQKKKKEQQLNKDINQEKIKKSNMEKCLENLEKTIAELTLNKEVNQKQKEQIEKKIKEINNEILIIIVRLQSASQRLNDISMRTDYHMTDNEYIDAMIKKYKEVYGENCEKIKELEKMKQYNQRFLNTAKLKREELFKLDHSQLADLLKKLNF